MASPELTALAHCLAGEFDNREQAMAEPAWYVHLRLWQRPVPLFTEDSLTLFAEQASVVNLDQPYRPRLMRLQDKRESNAGLQVQYYMPKDLEAIRGASCNLALLKTLTPDQFDLLPGCLLNVTYELPVVGNRYRFTASLPPDNHCCFTYLGKTQQVSLGFEAGPEEFLSYDKGIDSTTGRASWGAIIGPFRFHKRQDFPF